jgi:hypothetical protein
VLRRTHKLSKSALKSSGVKGAMTGLVEMSR